jgi:hypothetical protein
VTALVGMPRDVVAVSTKPRFVNYARRPALSRRKGGAGSVVVGLLGVAVAIAGAAALGGLLVLTAVGLGFYARNWLSLARRSRVGTLL